MDRVVYFAKTRPKKATRPHRYLLLNGKAMREKHKDVKQFLNWFWEKATWRVQVGISRKRELTSFARSRLIANPHHCSLLRPSMYNISFRGSTNVFALSGKTGIWSLSFLLSLRNFFALCANWLNTWKMLFERQMMSALAYFSVFLKSEITFKIKCNCKESGKRMLG